MHRPLGFPDWETLYKEQDVEKMRIRSGSVLDLGTGNFKVVALCPGNNAKRVKQYVQDPKTT